ncbi:Protein FAR1-RELATED SEQUENCE 11 [Bienertia sinuspersici]
MGQTFLSEEEAWVFYKNYARLHGFSIQKDRFQKQDGVITRRDFYCHHSRSQPLKEIDPNKEQRNRVSIRCNCNSHLRIKLRRCNEIFDEELHVTTFIEEHNHPLLSQSQVRFLPANRMISEEDDKHILILKEAGLTVRQIILVIELEKNLEHGELPFLEKYIRNLFTNVRKLTFLAIMMKAPKTIITDHDPWMNQAIAQELPYTKHCFCIWHITSKFSGWFTSILRDKYQEWCKDFYTLFKLETIEDFENQWPPIVSKYNLLDNKHVKGLYHIKEFWAPPYLRNYYFEGMRTTRRSEYITVFFKRFVTSTSTLTDPAKQVDVAVREIIQR